MNHILESTPSMESIKKWTCEYVERELDDIQIFEGKMGCTVIYLNMMDVLDIIIVLQNPFYKGRSNAGYITTAVKL